MTEGRLRAALVSIGPLLGTPSGERTPPCWPRALSPSPVLKMCSGLRVIPLKSPRKSSLSPEKQACLPRSLVWQKTRQKLGCCSRGQWRVHLGPGSRGQSLLLEAEGRPSAHQAELPLHSQATSSDAEMPPMHPSHSTGWVVILEPEESGKAQLPRSPCWSGKRPRLGSLLVLCPSAQVVRPILMLGSRTCELQRRGPIRDRCQDGHLQVAPWASPGRTRSEMAQASLLVAKCWALLHPPGLQVGKARTTVPAPLCLERAREREKPRSCWPDPVTFCKVVDRRPALSGLAGGMRRNRALSLSGCVRGLGFAGRG